jgi:hypothetical protein
MMPLEAGRHDAFEIIPVSFKGGRTKLLSIDKLFLFCKVTCPDLQALYLRNLVWSENVYIRSLVWFNKGIIDFITTI